MQHDGTEGIERISVIESEWERISMSWCLSEHLKTKGKQIITNSYKFIVSGNMQLVWVYVGVFREHNMR